MNDQSNSSLPPEFADIRPDVYRAFKQAVETRKWPDGRTLNEEQMQTCVQAIIAYEAKHLTPEERTGYVPPKETACDHKDEPEASTKPIKWQDS